MSYTDGAPDFTPRGRDERDGAVPHFYKKAKLNGFKSNQEGRPIHDDVEFVEIHVPGDRKTIVDTPVKEEHRQRWPQEYARFKAGEETPISGTALEDWPPMSRAMVEDLRYAKIRTVEQLAGLTDAQIAAVIPMGGNALREKAKRFLEAAAGSAPTEKLAAENEALRGNMATMEATMRALQAQVAALTAPKAPE